MIKTSSVRIEKFSVGRTQKSFQDFNLTPAELEAYLDEYMIGQKEAKAIISTKVCTHFHKIRYYYLREGREEDIEFVKNNIFIIGPTGVGKTYMIKLISKKLGVPFVKGDATKFSETGYVGGDIEDLIRELYWEANGDLEKAHFGIVFLDEIDKIASAGETVGPDVSRTGVQRALLKPLEETDIEIKVPQDGYGGLEFQESVQKSKKKRIILNTRYVLFIVSGAFQGLDQIIKKRIKKQSMGFISEIEGREEIKFNYLKFVIPEDLVAYGFEREFIGRFPVIAVFDPLSQEELFEILSNPNNPIMLNKKRDFKVYGIDLAFTDEALKEIANLAYKENTGARALSRILERILIYFERTLPSKSFKFLGVTEELIKDPEGFLKALLESPNNIRWRENYYKALEDEKKRVKKYVSSKVKYMEEEKFELTPKRLNLIFDLYKERDIELNKALEDVLFLWRQVKNYEKAFERKNNVKIIFTEDTIDTILENAIKKNWGVFAYCEKVMSRLEYSFNYLRDILAEEVFYITPLALKRPQKYVEEYLRKIKQ